MNPSLEEKGDFVAQVEGEGHSEDVKDPPARFVSHYVFEHRISLPIGLFPENVAQGVNNRNSRQMDEPPPGFQKRGVAPEFFSEVGHEVP
jgi:hypothetical protein